MTASKNAGQTQGKKAMTKRTKKKAQSPKSRGRGRPSKYCQKLAEEICERLAGGESLRSICRDDYMPDERAVRLWAVNNGAFSPQYVRAREIAFLRMADEILDIADDGSNDYLERQRDDGTKYTVIDHENIHRSRLRVDTRKWILAKMLPKVFGERVTNAITGADGGPVQIEDNTPNPIDVKLLTQKQRDALRDALMAAKRLGRPDEK
jgi:hypothetical protein